MHPAPHSPEGYINRIRMSGNNIIVVEGRSDKRVLEILLDELKSQRWSVQRPVVIDTAEIIGSPPHRVLSNRDKVRAIAVRLRTTELNNRFAGLIDREFRGF